MTSHRYDVHIGRYSSTIQLEDLDRDSRELAELIGIEAMRAVLVAFGGESIHIPMPRRVRPAVERFIISHYERYENGTDNARDLARDVGVSVRVVRRIIGQRREE